MFFRNPNRYKASRFTKGNFIFPDRIYIEQETIVFYKPFLLTSEERSIPYEQIASVSVKQGVIFSDIIFETTGGSHPITINGFWNSSATKLKRLVEEKVNYEMEKGNKGEEIIEVLKEQNLLLKELIKVHQSQSYQNQP